MDKDSIRKYISNLKQNLSEGTKLHAATSVFRQIEQLDIFAKSRNILLYNSLPDELSTLHALSNWGYTKNIFLPRVNGINLEILPYNSGNITIGAFNIKEPTGSDTVMPSAIDMMIIPAVAYDLKGNRVGRGKGYYDRLLSQDNNAIKIGIGYDFQIIEQINPERHDIPVDLIITPNNLIYTQHN